MFRSRSASASRKSRSTASSKANTRTPRSIAAEQALLAFGREVIENVRVAEPVFAAMRAHFSEQEIVELILAIGFYMTMARLTEATEVDLDPAAGMTVFEGGKKRSG